ncbi:MAG: hypothetical protein DWQ49_10555 [Bacteroidetes bacterium]|nr:MAG: hypothetical protein DWQ49_10555 [Bacteroidota bacterium]
MAISITIEPTNTVVTANLALADAGAASVSVTPTGSITSTTLQGALEELAAQDFRSNAAPTGNNVEVGDTWYDTDDNIFYVYRTIDGVTDWRPLVSGDDVSDGGTF